MKTKTRNIIYPMNRNAGDVLATTEMSYTKPYTNK